MNQVYEVGQKLNINIKNIGINGEGIGYYEKMAIFVDQVLPNENVDVEITEVYHNRIVAKKLNILKESEHRIKPFCPIYDKCGGCQLQHLESKEVARTKRNIVLDAYQRYTHRNLPKDIVENTITAKDEKGYRHKVSLPVRFTGKNHVGMYEAGTRNFIQMDDCPIQHPALNEVVATILELMNQYGIKGFDEKYKKGHVLTLIARISTLNEIQVTLVIQKNHSKYIELAKDLMKKDKRVVSVFKVFDRKGQKVGFFNDSLRKIKGKDTITEKLGGYEFSLTPEAFFQLNPIQAHRFYTEMVKLAGLRRFHIAIDAYAGSAPISHYIAASCKKVYAIEVDQKSCESAKLSLEKNHIKNVVVLQSTFKRALSGLQKKKIDVMFFDPPRTGLGKDTIDLILKSKPKRIVYGSCNPSTLAKDLNLLLKAYKLEVTKPLDMFPQTSLVESVSLLTLK